MVRLDNTITKAESQHYRNELAEWDDFCTINWQSTSEELGLVLQETKQLLQNVI